MVRGGNRSDQDVQGLVIGGKDWSRRPAACHPNSFKVDLVFDRAPGGVARGALFCLNPFFAMGSLLTVQANVLGGEGEVL